MRKYGLTPFQYSLDDLAAQRIFYRIFHVSRSVSLDHFVKGKLSFFPSVYEHRDELLWIAVAHDTSDIRPRVVHGLKYID